MVDLALDREHKPLRQFFDVLRLRAQHYRRVARWIVKDFILALPVEAGALPDCG